MHNETTFYPFLQMYRVEINAHLQYVHFQYRIFQKSKQQQTKVLQYQ